MKYFHIIIYIFIIASILIYYRFLQFNIKTSKEEHVILFTITFFILIFTFYKLNRENSFIFYVSSLLLFLLFYLFIPSKYFGDKSNQYEKDFIFSQAEARRHLYDNNVVEGFSFLDSTNNSGGGGNIDYSKGWDSPDNFKNTYCTKGAIVENGQLNDPKNIPLIYGFIPDIYDMSNNKVNDNFAKPFNEMAGKINYDSINSDNGCSADKWKGFNSDNSKSTIMNLCNPKCNWKFK